MPDLPSGIVTFLFTDVEGSTRLWRLFPEVMPDALARHDLLLHQAVEGHQGTIYKVVGDGYQAAFPTPDSAITAALEAQYALHGETWKLPEPLRVRMALHAGNAEPLPDGDYRTSALNRLGRLLGAGHGGQVLLSEAVAVLVRDNLPDGAELRDLGLRRLRDLSPERIYQLLAPGLSVVFPPLRTLDARSHNLPAPPTPLIGRENEVATASALLRDRSIRLLTLTGPGGTGKTRLAMAIASTLIDDFDDGVTFISLESIRDPDLVVPEIARELGVQEDAGRKIADSVIDHMRGKRLLLFLDNFEQVAPAASHIARFLSACPDLTILVTSRVRLRLRAEREFPVQPLKVPDLAAPLDPDTLMRSEAVRLFAERATAIDPHFSIATDARAVAEICSRLDGLPLAIELAAARIDLVTPSEMATRLEKRLPELTEGAWDLPDRQRTLRDTIAWSYELLPPEEQALFRSLAIFVGGWTVDDARVVPARMDGDVEAVLTSLVEKSLVRRIREPADDRYAMLETIREYGLEQLEIHGELEDLRSAHAACFHARMEALAPLTWGTDQARGLEQIDAEIDNLRAALAWAEDHAETQTMLDICISLEKFWDVRGYLAEGRAWLERGLALPMDGVRPGTMAQAHSNAGSIAQAQGDLEGARSLQERALDILRGFDTEGGRRGTAHTLNRLGIIEFLQGNYERANALHADALERFRALDEPSSVATVLNNLGVTADQRGDFAAARHLYEEALELQRKEGDLQSVAIYLGNLGEVTRDQGDFIASAAYYREALTLWAELGDRWNTTSTLDGVAALAISSGQPERAARLFGAAEAFREAAGVPLAANERADHDEVMAAGRQAVGDDAFESGFRAGHGLTLAQAIAEAEAVTLDVS